MKPLLRESILMILKMKKRSLMIIEGKFLMKKIN